jgi:hypothetical protein
MRLSKSLWREENDPDIACIALHASSSNVTIVYNLGHQISNRASKIPSKGFEHSVTILYNVMTIGRISKAKAYEVI